MAFEQTLKDFQENEKTVLNKPVEPDVSEERFLGIINKVIATPDGEKLIRFFLDKKVPVLFSQNVGFAEFDTNIILEKGKINLFPGTQAMLLNPAQDDDKLVFIFCTRRATPSNIWLGWPCPTSGSSRSIWPSTRAYWKQTRKPPPS